MHSYLSKVGISKLDVIHSLEYVSEEYGGRVELAKAYYKGLTNSLIKNFNGSGLISSMQQWNDFWFQDPKGVCWLQGVHLIHCAYNRMWMGQIIQPDWDMFQSNHSCAKFHAGSRAICGGPVYVSESLGGHDFELLKKLVYPDGTIPKCQHFALPTRDCRFKNPLFDNQTVLKIWNFNKRRQPPASTPPSHQHLPASSSSSLLTLPAAANLFTPATAVVGSISAQVCYCSDE